MRKCVLILLIVVASLGWQSCAENAPSAVQDSPELLKAVPSDALCVGVFSRLDRGMERMVDSASVLRNLDFGRLSRSHAAIALLIIEAGRSGADTLDVVRNIMAMADSMKVWHALFELDTHNALLLSPSSTVITVAGRHVAAESSILDAPDFQQVVDVLSGADAVVLRNRGASRLLDLSFGQLNTKAVAGFIRDAAEWTVLCNGHLHPVVPDDARYFCNFMGALEEGTSKLSACFPEGADAIIDLPVSSIEQWRKAYENWLDARIALESYQKRMGTLAKASGKKPLNWEKEQGVKELACVMMQGGTLNMVRVSKSQNSDGVQKNPYTGFVRALYGAPFDSSDSLCLRCGAWLVSGGDRALLDSFRVSKKKPSDWPAAAKAVAWRPDGHISWTKDNIKIWDSNR